MLPAKLAFLAGLAGLKSREFAIGWANGLVRWHGGVKIREAGCETRAEFARNPFDKGSTKFAASQAALTYMLELEQK